MRTNQDPGKILLLVVLIGAVLSLMMMTWAARGYWEKHRTEALE